MKKYIFHTQETVVVHDRHSFIMLTLALTMESAAHFRKQRSFFMRILRFHGKRETKRKNYLPWLKYSGKLWFRAILRFSDVKWISLP